MYRSGSPFLATCQVKPEGENECGLPFVFITRDEKIEQLKRRYLVKILLEVSSYLEEIRRFYFSSDEHIVK